MHGEFISECRLIGWALRLDRTLKRPRTPPAGTSAGSPAHTPIARGTRMARGRTAPPRRRERRSENRDEALSPSSPASDRCYGLTPDGTCTSAVVDRYHEMLIRPLRALPPPTLHAESQRRLRKGPRGS